MKTIQSIQKNKILGIAVLALLLLFPSCSKKNTSAVSSSGISLYYMGLSAIYSGSALPADGSSQATIMVEVWDQAGTYVDGATVNLTVSRGTLGATTLTTVNGVATTTFTAGAVPGNAYVNATVENAAASVTIVLARF